MLVLILKIMKTSKRTLVYLAAAVWYIGGIMLLRSGLELIVQIRSLKGGTLWPAIFIVLGIGLGVFQALVIFSSSCRRNLQRINLLENPRLWQFFRPGFFLALAIMITCGILMDRFSQGHYFVMLGVAAVDFALAVSLLGSSYIFWTEFKHIDS